MAIFMTIGMLQFLTGSLTSWPSLVMLLFRQLAIGLLVGVAIGFLAVWALKNIRLQVAGLYPILAVAFGLMSYGLAADLGGSGFLATYLSGVVIGNHHTPFNRGIQAFHEALAWLGQIIMFILLGLLSFPSRLLDVFVAGLAIAAVLTLISRPLAVFVCLFRSRFVFSEKLLLSWVGLKGAVPITLAIFPLMANVEGASKIFDVVFFIVLASAVLQGSTLKWFANKLNLHVKPKREPPVTLEISSLYEVEADIVDYFIECDSLVVGKAIRDLALPYEVVIALIVRQGHSKLPKGSFRIEAGDHVIVVVHRSVRHAVDRVFSRSHLPGPVVPWPEHIEFPLRGSVKLSDLQESYGVDLTGEPGVTLGQWLRMQVPDRELIAGTIVHSGRVKFSVRDLDATGGVVLVGMAFLKEGTPDVQGAQSVSELTDGKGA
jgi:cell volume regulation protein A